jgi:thioesterase domain-containing protein
MQVRWAALDRYRPGPLPCDVTLVRATISTLGHARAPQDLHWAEVVTGELRIVTVNGTHEELLRQPHLAATAAAVANAIGRGG